MTETGRNLAGIAANEAATLALGAALAQALPPDRVIALHGDLGAGKTTLVKGLAAAWGITTAITSPTFAIYTLYHGDRQLIHLDAYRLNSPAQAEDLCLSEFLRHPWCLAVEWPENVPPTWLHQAWTLELSISPECPQQRHWHLSVPEPDAPPQTLPGATVQPDFRS